MCGQGKLVFYFKLCVLDIRVTLIFGISDCNKQIANSCCFAFEVQIENNMPQPLYNTCLGPKQKPC